MPLRTPLLHCVIISFSLHRFVNGLPEVQLGETTIIGLSLPQFGQEFFGGIPFAEPPIGPLRFSPPVLKLSPGVSKFNATTGGLACTQSLGFTPGLVPFNAEIRSEDCLTMDILRPSGLYTSSALPVMVWVHGGGFLDGSTSQYNGSSLVLQSVQRGTPIVYIDVNYRLGPLGFPQGEEAERRGATNLGSKDVITALTWIQSNVGVFGGDKEKVTVFGVSAGAITISHLLLNESFDLARAAIFQSGSAATLKLVHARDREGAWKDFVSGVPECSGASSDNTFDCLRTASLDTIFNATNLALKTIQEEFPFMPVIDGPGGIVPDLPSRLFARRQFARIPFIAGTNLDEGTLFIPESTVSTAQVLEWLLANSTPSVVSSAEQGFVANTLLGLYPDVPALGSPFGTGNETFGLSSEFKRASALFGDIAFTSLRRQWTQVASREGVKVFAYLLTDPQTLAVPPSLGVAHSSEVPYVYGEPRNGPASVALSQTMIDYWLSFATSLDPNDGHGNASRPAWIQYTEEAEGVLELNSGHVAMVPDTFRKKMIEFINAHPEALLH